MRSISVRTSATASVGVTSLAGVGCEAAHHCAYSSTVSARPRVTAGVGVAWDDAAAGVEAGVEVGLAVGDAASGVGVGAAGGVDVGFDAAVGVEVGVAVMAVEVGVAVAVGVAWDDSAVAVEAGVAVDVGLGSSRPPQPAARSASASAANKVATRIARVRADRRVMSRQHKWASRVPLGLPPWRRAREGTSRVLKKRPRE